MERKYGFRPDGNDVQGEGPAPRPEPEPDPRKDVPPRVRVRFDNGFIIDKIGPEHFTEI